MDNGYLYRLHMEINDIFWSVEYFYKFIVSFIILQNFIKSCVVTAFWHQHVTDEQIRDMAMFV